MTETQKRIRAYKRALPHMKERVIAVALLLAMSVSMMSSATFAWITLSTSPEVSSLATTIATNGNLEIALSDADGMEPDETAVGDGGQDITLSNLAWGNLINLSNSSYGLNSLTLRPAILNSSSLDTSPLYSVTYGADGRVEDIISDFAFTNFQKTADGEGTFFVPTDGKTQYGVRAISSVTYESVQGDAMLRSLNNAVTREKQSANQLFATLYNNDSYMNTITNMAGVYLQYRMDDVDQDCTAYVEPVYDMMTSYGACLNQIGQSLLSISNLYYFIDCNKSGQTYIPFTIEELNNGTVKSRLASLEKLGAIVLDAMDMYLSNYETFYVKSLKGDGSYGAGLYERYYNDIYKSWNAGESIGWEAMREYINPMADINSATVNGTAASALGASDLVKLALASSKVCVLTKGLILDMDQMLGGEGLSRSGVSLTAMGYNVTISEIKTARVAPYSLEEDVKKANQRATEGGLAATDAVAADTYGMAVDFWLRTNAQNSLLVLEGELVTETVVMTDENGEPILDDDGNQMVETVVTGYSGANRIWEKNDPNLPVLGTSSTQGSGSCYIFYPDSPENQAQALEMLKAMCVAFIDSNGNLLAQADLDTVNAIEDMGRVVVPLQLRAKSIESTDQEGNTILETSYHITDLKQNEATRVTAIIYMDGSRMSNSQVLSSGAIQGQLNIQFGTTENVIAMDDNELKKEFYTIEVSATPTSFESFDSSNLPKSNLTLTLNGMEASTITGSFISFVSTTQGARQKTFEFTYQSGAVWTAEVPFNGPGTYQLRSVQVDGVDYALEEEQRVTVTVPGISVGTLTCDGWDGQNSYYHMTADSYYPLEMDLSLNLGLGINPKTVQGIFAHEDGQNVTMTFTRTETGYTAKGNFTTSGTYTMSYVIVDGNYIPLGDQTKTLTLNLGLQARVFVGQPVTAAYEAKLASLEREEADALANATSDEEKEEIKALYKTKKEDLLAELNGENGLKMVSDSSGYRFEYDGKESLFMDVSVTISDDKNQPMTGLTDLMLHYGLGSSVANRLDSELEWNSSRGRYVGTRFQLTRAGTYIFQSLELGDSLITSAVAPKVQAINPTPISYEPMKLEETDRHYTNISKTASRELKVMLKDSPSAEVQLVIQHMDEDVSDDTLTGILRNVYGNDTYERIVNGRTVTLTADVIDNFDDTYTYYVNAPCDGTWKIVGMYVSGAFYNGTFYDGISVEDGGSGWLDFSEKVKNDDIWIKFFTTVNFNVNKQPANMYEGTFMEDHKVEGMVVTVSDYLGQAFKDANGNNRASVTMSYTWNSATADAFTVDANTTYPNTHFGGDLATTDGKTFPLGDMNFQLDGQYLLKFSVTLDGVTYSNIDAFTTPADLRISNLPVTVNWTIPVVKFTNVNPQGSVKTNSGSATSIKLTTVQNTVEDYKCVAYLSCEKKSFIISYASYTAPTVTAAISGAGTKFNSASVFFDGADVDVTFSFDPTQLTSTQTVGKTQTAVRDYLGSNKTTNVLTMTYLKDGTTYTFKLKLKNELTLSQPS